MSVQNALANCNRCWDKSGDWTKKMKIKRGFAALAHDSTRELVRKQVILLWKVPLSLSLSLSLTNLNRTQHTHLIQSKPNVTSPLG